MELNYKTFGEGEPIVFLHGLFGMLDNWQTFGKRFAELGYMVYLIDQRDHGKSPRTDAFDYHILAEDLHHFLESNWLYDATIVGHSMGGKTLLQYLSQDDDYVSKAVVVDMGVKRYKGGHEIVFDALRSIDPSKATNRKSVYEHIKSYLGDDEGTIQFLMKNLKRVKEGGFEWKMNLPLLWDNYSKILDEVTFDSPVGTDTLFVRGGESKYVLDEDWAEIASHFTSAELVTVEGAGHWVHAQKPNELFEAILTFIAQ